MAPSDVNVIIAKMDFMLERFDSMNSIVKEHVIEFKDHAQNDIVVIKDLTKTIKEEYASKWVEKFSVGIISSVLTSVLGASLYILLKH